MAIDASQQDGSIREVLVQHGFVRKLLHFPVILIPTPTRDPGSGMLLPEFF